VTARWPDAFSDGVVNPCARPPGGESLDQLSHRVRDFLETMVDRQADGPVYVITHNGWIRMALLLNGDITIGRLFATPVPFLEPIELDLKPDRLRERRPTEP